jgi:hypothetical protein
MTRPHSISKSHFISIFIAISILFVIVSYVWFISFGSWTKWLSQTNYYDQLATAFQHGSLSLETQPDPALLALPNPYNPNKRGGIDFPLDFSLYKGKFYLYFGPVPAVLLLIFKLMGSGVIGDEILAFAFISGIFISQSLLIIKLWKRFFQDIPSWVIPLCIMFCGLISPWTWMLSEARIYEAAGGGAQFFFLMGLYFIITALMDDISPTQFFMGGISWVLALGSRITQALPIGFVTFLIALFFIRTYSQNKSLPKAIVPMLSLCLPLAIGMCALGWYNWARFDSVFETGFIYELTTPYLQKYSNVLFSPLYILPNLYEYLVAPPRFTYIFPFLQSIRGKGYLIFSFIDLPPIYYTRAVTGMIFTTPFVLFAGVPVISTLFAKTEVKDQTDQDDNNYLYKWVVAGLLGSFLFGFATIASYFWVVTRFLADAIPSLILLAIIGFWLGYRFLNHRTIIRKLYLAGGIGLMFVSIGISTLVMLSARASIYQSINPILWNQLVSLFSR